MIEMKSRNIKNTESKKNRKNKKDNGITLIALIITIIVLLILAGITITSITSDNGIIQNALSAKERTEIDNEREIVEQATVQAMGNNKRGNIVRNELQDELDKITGEGKTIVTADTEEQGYFVKFVDSGRIYKVSIDGEVTYLGKEDELLTRADITANPESDTTPKLTQEVELTVKTLIDIGDVDYTLVYAWSSSQDIAPEDSEFEVADLTGEGRIRTTNVSSNVSAEGNYYLWVRAVVGEIEQETCFGPYAIRDHTMLMRVNESDSLSDAGFLGNATVKRGLIKSITIQNTLGGHSLSDANTWDVTENGNGRYLAWYEGDEENGYDVTIAGEGGIVANSIPVYLFRNIGSGITDTNIEVTITGLEYLDTGLATGSMAYMFENCKATNLRVSKFNTSNVTNMQYMFSDCTNLTSLDLSSFDTHNVTNMAGMFNNCSITSLNLSNFDTSKVTNMLAMFLNCKATNIDVSSFDTSNVTTMQNMFNTCRATSLDLSSFNTSNVTTMREMFNNCSATTLDLSNFNTSKVTNMYRMFGWCKASEIDVSNFDISNVTYPMEGMFRECVNLVKLDASSFTKSKTNSVEWMFGRCSSIEEIDLSNFEVNEGVNINQMFYNCPSLEKLDIRKFDITNTTGYNTFWMWTVPTNCEIIVKDSMKEWFTENYPNYTNVIVGN